MADLGGGGVSGGATSSYVYIRYASDASGTGLSATPSVGLNYIAVKTTNVSIATPIASDFTGLWFQWKGASGGATNTVLSGTVDPTTEGSDGDFYINKSTFDMFGPKTAGAWGLGTSLTGPSGSSGASGADGANGTNGTNGATIVYGTVAPDNGVGNNGDSYIDTVNCMFYPDKAAGVWGSGFSMIGPAGSSGAAGSTILYGTVAPDNGIGSNGDSYYDTANKVFYSNKASGVWPAGTSLVGPSGSTGANGADGKTILYGTVAPSNGLGNNGDSYYDIANKVFYANKAAGVWPTGVSLIGPTGATGAAGSNGATGSAGAQGDKGGFRFNFSSSTSMADPGVGQVRFNAATTGATTQIAQSVTMIGGASIYALLATARVSDVWKLSSNANGDTTFCLFRASVITDNTTWYRFDVQFIAGTIPTNAEQCVFELVYAGVRSDADGNLIDALGNVISGLDYGTYATLPDPTVNQREYRLVTDYGKHGLLYFVPNGGSSWVIPWEQPLIDDVVGIRFIGTNSGLTWSVSSNGGNVRLTSNPAHGLTAGNADNNHIHVSAGTGWTANSFHQITVFSTTVLDTTTPFASQGAPTVTVFNTEVELKSVALPPLNENSAVIVEQTNVLTGSTNNKNFRYYLDATEMSNQNTVTATNIVAHSVLGFRNYNSKSVQRTFHSANNNSGAGVMGVGFTDAAVNTATSKNVRFTVKPAAVNEMIGLDTLRILVRG